MPEVKSTGQEVGVWNDFWKGLTPEKEIRMWDFYGGRPWIMKYTPRFGKTVEAGCGLGRYNFIFNRFGVDMEGLDFEPKTIDSLLTWQKENGFDASFIVGDVTNMPYEDNSLSGYISLGVVEHFIEGPHRPINEAYRVLRPGGVAIITTPARSLYLRYRDVWMRGLKDTIRKIIGKPAAEQKFFQYWYQLPELTAHVERSGLRVTHAANCDLPYAFFEYGGETGENIINSSFVQYIMNNYENSGLTALGSQSITISVKKAETMHCFLCGELSAKLPSLENYDVPVCGSCSGKPNAAHYRKGVRAHLNLPFEINPRLLAPEERTCDYTGEKYTTDPILEDYGFSKNASPGALKNPEINIELSNSYLRAVWRLRKAAG